MTYAAFVKRLIEIGSKAQVSEWLANFDGRPQYIKYVVEFAMNVEAAPHAFEVILNHFIADSNRDSESIVIDPSTHSVRSVATLLKAKPNVNLVNLFTSDTGLKFLACLSIRAININIFRVVSETSKGKRINETIDRARGLAPPCPPPLWQG